MPGHAKTWWVNFCRVYPVSWFIILSSFPNSLLPLNRKYFYTVSFNYLHDQIIRFSNFSYIQVPWLNSWTGPPSEVLLNRCASSTSPQTEKRQRDDDKTMDHMDMEVLPLPLNYFMAIFNFLSVLSLKKPQYNLSWNHVIDVKLLVLWRVNDSVWFIWLSWVLTWFLLLMLFFSAV